MSKLIQAAEQWLTRALRAERRAERAETELEHAHRRLDEIQPTSDGKRYVPDRIAELRPIDDAGRENLNAELTRLRSENAAMQGVCDAAVVYRNSSKYEREMAWRQLSLVVDVFAAREKQAGR